MVNRGISKQNALFFWEDGRSVVFDLWFASSCERQCDTHGIEACYTLHS